jgi:hypothetical protein
MKTTRTLLALAAIVSFSLHSFGQIVPVLKWVKSYSSIDSASNIPTAIDASGNVIVAGYSTSLTNGDDYTIIKYDQSGNQLWVRSFDGAYHGNDQLTALAVDASGNVVVTGESQTALGSAFVTIKYDPSGNQQWLASYQGNANDPDRPAAIGIDPAGNVYVTGGNTGYNQGSVTIKYSPSGSQLWINQSSFNQ